MDALKYIFREIKERRIRKWLAIYISTSLTVIYLINLISNRYNVPNFVFDYALLIVIFGFFSMIIFAWFHGKEGKQNFSWKELIAHSFIVLAALSFILFIRKVPAEQKIVLEANSIAVLPFNNLSDSKEDEYFSDGVTEDILTNLSKINDLKVISRTSSMKYKNTDKSIKEIGHELGVSTILEGSVRRSGNRLRIVGQLIDVKTDQHIWSETYDRELKDIFEIQSDVASRIAASLKTELSAEEKVRIEKKPTQSIDAYAYYLKGRELYNRYQPKDNDQAIEMFDKALSLDSNYALAYAGLADAYAQRAGLFDHDKAWLDTSIQLSNKALSLNVDLAEGYKSLGVAYVYYGEFRKAIENYNKAVEINPNYAPAVSNLGSMYFWIGEYDKAYEWAKKAVTLDPARASSYGTLGLIFAGLTLDSASEKWTKAALDLQPNSSIRHTELTKLYLAEGNYDKARTYIHKILETNPTDATLLTAAGEVELFAGNLNEAIKYYDSSFVYSDYYTMSNSSEYLYILLKLGYRDRAVKGLIDLKKITEQNLKQNNYDFNIPYDLARINVVLGNYEDAVNYLHIAIVDGWRFYRFWKNDPLIENLHQNKVFIKMVNDLEMNVNGMREKVLEYEEVL